MQSVPLPSRRGRNSPCRRPRWPRPARRAAAPSPDVRRCRRSTNRRNPRSPRGRAAGRRGPPRSSRTGPDAVEGGAHRVALRHHLLVGQFDAAEPLGITRRVGGEFPLDRFVVGRLVVHHPIPEKSGSAQVASIRRRPSMIRGSCPPGGVVAAYKFIHLVQPDRCRRQRRRPLRGGNDHDPFPSNICRCCKRNRGDAHRAPRPGARARDDRLRHRPGRPDQACRRRTRQASRRRHLG